MTVWWQTLSARERILVIFALSVITIAGFFLAIWEPLAKRVTTLRETVKAERNQVAWMEQAALEIHNQKGTNSTSKKAQGESLLTIIDRSVRKAGMGANLNRIEPEGKDKVRLWLNNLPFETIISWLVELNKSEGVTPESFVVDRQTTPGRVNARLVLLPRSN